MVTHGIGADSRTSLADFDQDHVNGDSFPFLASGVALPGATSCRKRYSVAAFPHRR